MRMCFFDAFQGPGTEFLGARFCRQKELKVAHLQFVTRIASREQQVSSFLPSRSPNPPQALTCLLRLSARFLFRPSKPQTPIEAPSNRPRRPAPRRHASS